MYKLWAGCFELEKNIEISLLFDFYGGLLKPAVRSAVDLYYNDDLSLAEIAAETGITRQGVRDSIKRGELALFEFEKKLGLLGRFSQLESGLDEIARAAEEIALCSHDMKIKTLAESIVNAAGALKEKE